MGVSQIAQEEMSRSACMLNWQDFVRSIWCLPVVGHRLTFLCLGFRFWELGLWGCLAAHGGQFWEFRGSWVRAHSQGQRLRWRCRSRSLRNLGCCRHLWARPTRPRASLWAPRAGVLHAHASSLANQVRNTCHSFLRLKCWWNFGSNSCHFFWLKNVLSWQLALDVLRVRWFVIISVFFSMRGCSLCRFFQVVIVVGSLFSQFSILSLLFFL